MGGGMGLDYFGVEGGISLEKRQMSNADVKKKMHYELNEQPSCFEVCFYLQVFKLLLSFKSMSRC